MFHIFILDENVGNSALLLLAFKRVNPDISIYTISDSRLLPAYLDTKSPIETMRSRTHPDILVIPMAKSFYHGLETLGWIRAHARFDAMFVVVLSSRDDPAEREQVLIAGADAFHHRSAESKQAVQLAEKILHEYASFQSKAAQCARVSVPDLACT